MIRKRETQPKCKPTVTSRTATCTYSPTISKEREQGAHASQNMENTVHSKDSLLSCNSRTQRHQMKYTGSSFEQHGSTSVHYIKLTCRTHCCRTLTKQISALNAPTIKNKFQVKKSPSETPAEASNKCSIFAPFSCSFSKPLWTVARKRMLAKTSLSGLCSDTNWSCFYVLISQWIWVGNWEHTEKAKQLSSAVGVELRSLSDRRDSLHKTVGSLTGARDTGRGIVYARRIQEKIGKNKYNFYDVANMCRTPRVPSTLPTTDPQQG